MHRFRVFHLFSEFPEGLPRRPLENIAFAIGCVGEGSGRTSLNALAEVADSGCHSHDRRALATMVFIDGYLCAWCRCAMRVEYVRWCGTSTDIGTLNDIKTMARAAYGITS
jgi:hypothetical protein